MPLSFDLPLKDLHKYKGISPKPKDFDSFWQTQLNSLDGVSDDIELVPSSFKSKIADCFHLYFKGVGGAKVHAKYLRPKLTDKPNPAIIMFHGYSMNSGDWCDKLALVGEGYSVLALDVRGQGGLSQDNSQTISGNTQNGHIIRGIDGNPENLLFVKIFLDCVQIVKIAQKLEEVDGDKIAVTGKSQGGALSIACAALSPSVKLCASVYPFLSDYKRVWEMDQAKDAYAELKQYFTRHDPLHEREDEFFNKLGYIDISNLADKIKAEVLMMTGYSDTICPPSTQFAIYNRIISKKSMLAYPDFGHEHLPQADDKILTFFRAL